MNNYQHEQLPRFFYIRGKTHTCINKAQSMAVVNGPPLQSMGLCGFVLAENQISAERVQEEPMEIKGSS